MTPMPTEWWLRPDSSAARVGAHSAVVWKRLYFRPFWAKRSAVGVVHGPPKALEAAKPTSSSRTTRTFGAPAGGRSGSIAANDASGSLASYGSVPANGRSGIGSTPRCSPSGSAWLTRFLSTGYASRHPPGQITRGHHPIRVMPHASGHGHGHAARDAHLPYHFDESRQSKQQLVATRGPASHEEKQQRAHACPVRQRRVPRSRGPSSHPSPVTQRCRLSEPRPLSRPQGEWLWGWGCRSLRGRPGLSGSAATGAGDEMVDGSFRRRRLRPLGLFRRAAQGGRVPRHLWELAGTVGVIS